MRISMCARAVMRSGASFVRRARWQMAIMVLAFFSMAGGGGYDEPFCCVCTAPVCYGDSKWGECAAEVRDGKFLYDWSFTVVLALFALAFFFGAKSALTKRKSFVFGDNQRLAAMFALAVAMAGVAFGNWWLEGGWTFLVAVCALAVMVLYVWADGLMITLHPELASSPPTPPAEHPTHDPDDD